MRDLDDVIAGARKHPGLTVGSLALITGAAIVTILLMQRTGPRRYDWIRERLDPRAWVDAEAMRNRFEAITRTLSEGAEDIGSRAGSLSDETRYGAGRLLRLGRRATSPSARRRYARQAHDYASQAQKTARAYAGEAGQYARDHAREASALVAIATLAAVIGAAALEGRRLDNGVRRVSKI
jgi:hypothetical protein